MYFHAVELYFKSFLRLKGISIEELRHPKKYGHDLIKLSEKSEDLGLTVMPWTADALADFTFYNTQRDERYFRSRNGPQLNVEALWVITRDVREGIARHFGAPPFR